jgi:hypothetical protein
MSLTLSWNKQELLMSALQPFNAFELEPSSDSDTVKRNKNLQLKRRLDLFPMNIMNPLLKQFIIAYTCSMWRELQAAMHPA